jgi:hypothetical protein
MAAKRKTDSPVRGDLKKGAITYVKAPRLLILLCEPAAGA